MDVGEDADGHVAARTQLDGKALGHLLGCCLAEVLQHGCCHLLGYERVLMRNLTGQSLRVAGTEHFIGGNRFLTL